MSSPESKSTECPRHIVIIMDGNGRWAKQRELPRARGHQAGVRALRAIVEHSARLGLQVLTVFAFSSENWYRPPQEVRLLLDLFITSLENEVQTLQRNNVKLDFIGERSAFPPKLRKSIDASESATAHNNGLNLIVAANYGGRWDIARACSLAAEDAVRGRLDPAGIDEAVVGRYLSLAGRPDPDLLIRTGGEQRLSNYLLWQCAYSELFFTEELWPDFSPASLDQALRWYAGRQRRFGRIDEQLSRNAGTS